MDVLAHSAGLEVGPVGCARPPPAESDKERSVNRAGDWRTLLGRGQGLDAAYPPREGLISPTSRCSAALG